MGRKKSQWLKIDWSLVDWKNSTDDQIAAELCCSKMWVWHNRNKRNIPSVGQRGRKTIYHWDNIDWKLTDCEIARRCGDGRSQASCRYQRMKLGIPCHPCGKQKQKD